MLIIIILIGVLKTVVYWTICSYSNNIEYIMVKKLQKEGIVKL